MRVLASAIFSFSYAKNGVSLCLGKASNNVFSVWSYNICKTYSNMSDDSWKKASSVYDFTATDIEGNEVSLRKYEGNVLLIVNVASKCGLTSGNYKDLVTLDEKYKENGLRILAFPCNQFANQEPGTREEICSFAQKKNANFDFFDKVKVNGDQAHPLFKYLKEKQGSALGKMIKWNFTKFIVDRQGQPVARIGSKSDLKKTEEAITKYL